LDDIFSKNTPKEELIMQTMPRIDPEFEALVPPLSKEEYKQLEENILQNRKCRNAIVLYDGSIVDGYNRFKICLEHGITFEVVEMDFPDRMAAKVWMLDNQLGRRNLNDAMRIEIAMLKEEVLRKIAKKKLSAGGKKGGEKSSRKASAPEDSNHMATTATSEDNKPLPKTTSHLAESIHVQKELATDAGVGKGTLHRYTQIKDEGNPALLEQVQSGKLKIGTAHRMLRKQLLKQLRIADKTCVHIAENMPHINNPKAKEELRHKITNLTTKLYALLEKYQETPAPIQKEDAQA